MASIDSELDFLINCLSYWDIGTTGTINGYLWRIVESEYGGIALQVADAEGFERWAVSYYEEYKLSELYAHFSLRDWLRIVFDIED
jgi:hypothetical protein